MLLEFSGIIYDGDVEKVKEFLGDRFIRIDEEIIFYKNNEGTEFSFLLSPPVADLELMYFGPDGVIWIYSPCNEEFKLSSNSSANVNATGAFTPLEERLLTILGNCK